MFANPRDPLALNTRGGCVTSADLPAGYVSLKSKETARRATRKKVFTNYQRRTEQNKHKNACMLLHYIILYAPQVQLLGERR